MRKRILFSSALALALVTLAITPAAADYIALRGKVMSTQGHVSPACRSVQLRRNDDGSYVSFRIAATGQEDGVLATTLTAVATGLDVDLVYDPAQGSGCGSEPRIAFISLRAPTAP